MITLDLIKGKTFSHFGKTRYNTENLLSVLGYKYTTDAIEKQSKPLSESNTKHTENYIDKAFKRYSKATVLDNETARREGLISKVFDCAVDLLENPHLEIEATFNEWDIATGDIDYIFNKVIVVEATLDSTDTSINQTLIELIAYYNSSRYKDNPEKTVRAWLTDGYKWILFELDTDTHTIAKDVDHVSLPVESTRLLSYLIF